jgi:hypothetical protein
MLSTFDDDDDDYYKFNVFLGWGGERERERKDFWASVKVDLSIYWRHWMAKKLREEMGGGEWIKDSKEKR